jgi:hypothetical protein
MRTLFVTVAAALLTLPLLLVGGTAAAGPIVTGSGHISGSVLPYVDYRNRTLAVNAIEHKDGSISGKIQVVVHDTGIVVHMAVDCVRFIDEDTAFVTGEVTKSSDEDAVPVGVSGGLVVRDNGPDTDEVSPGLIFDDLYEGICDLFAGDANDAFLLSALGEIDDGNIKIH